MNYCPVRAQPQGAYQVSRVSRSRKFQRLTCGLRVGSGGRSSGPPSVVSPLTESVDTSLAAFQLSIIDSSGASTRGQPGSAATPPRGRSTPSARAPGSRCRFLGNAKARGESSQEREDMTIEGAGPSAGSASGELNPC